MLVHKPTSFCANCSLSSSVSCSRFTWTLLLCQDYVICLKQKTLSCRMYSWADIALENPENKFVEWKTAQKQFLQTIHQKSCSCLDRKLISKTTTKQARSVLLTLSMLLNRCSSSKLMKGLLPLLARNFASSSLIRVRIASARLSLMLRSSFWLFKKLFSSC